MAALRFHALFFWCVLFVLNLNGFPPIECFDNADALNDTQKAAVREAIRMILNIDEPLDTYLENGNVSEKSKTKYKIPKYFMELYETIDVGEIVRGIEPIPDFVPHFKDIIVYNMTSIGTKFEKIKTAELHIFRRRLWPQKGHLRKRLLPPPCRVRLYQVLTTPGSTASTGNSAEGNVKELSDIERIKLRSLDSIPVAQVTRGGWHIIDISMGIKEMLNSPGSATDFIFGVRFEGPKGKAIATQRFLKQPDVNNTSSFITIFSENTQENDMTERKMSMTNNQIDIMSDLLRNAASSETSKSKKKSQSMHKSKVKKLKMQNYDKPIRHGKKYYDNIEDPNNADYNEVTDRNAKYLNRYSKSSPGAGDISELLDFDRVKKVKAMRRHNHKSVNSLSLRYDTVTKSVVPKRVDKLEYDEEIDEGKSLNRSRRTRSVDDNELDIIEFTEQILNTDKDSSEKEMHKEDDMGDLSYYEPDVYMHEDLIPKSYRHQYHNEDAVGRLDDEDYARNDDQDRTREKQKGERRRHENRKRKNKKFQNKDAQEDEEDVGACHRSHIVINFQDIGMDYIIAPEEFNFGFCTGSCKKKSKLNRVGFQNIIRSFYSQPEIPEPCCVMKSAQTFSYLWVDKRRVTLRHFPNLIVDSCQCR